MSYGDAVSNNALELRHFFEEKGYKTEIYAAFIDSRVKKFAKYISEYDFSDHKDVIIYHMSIGTKLTEDIARLPNKKIMVYHNITPCEYFKFYNNKLYRLTKYGREQLKKLASCFDYVIADSEYNKTELEEYGFKNVRVLPVFMNDSNYSQKPEQTIIDKYDDGKTNILFVGRVAPNKKQEDLIKCFYYYKNYFNPNSRLFIVGENRGIYKYYILLEKLVKKLGLKDVYFTGHVSTEELVAYYNVADIFLSMSEHEGFCVPLVESMFFEIPILAYNAAAVPYILGDSGVLINRKDYIHVASLIDLVIKDTTISNKILKKQSNRLEQLNNTSVEIIWKRIIDEAK